MVMFLNIVLQSNSPHESVSKTAANLYAALAASALEDEDFVRSYFKPYYYK